MMAGMRALTAAWKVSSPPVCRLLHGSREAGPTSVLAVAWPRPRKYLATGITPAARSPAAKASPSAAAVASAAVNERLPMG
jgi:hypothetical protein